MAGDDIGRRLALDTTQRGIGHALGKSAGQFLHVRGRISAAREDVSCRRGVGVGDGGQSGTSSVEDPGGEVLLAGQDQGQLALVHDGVLRSGRMDSDVTAGGHCGVDAGLVVEADLQGPAGDDLAGSVEGGEGFRELLIGAWAEQGDSLRAVTRGRAGACGRHTDGVHRNTEMLPGIGVGVRGDDEVDELGELIRSLVGVGGEQDDDRTVGLASDREISDLVETVGIGHDDRGLVVEALAEVLASFLLTVE